MYLLKLVNKQNPLSADFVPETLVEDDRSKIWICECALKAFLNLNTHIIKAGMPSLVLVSGYRAYDYQKNLYNRKISWLISRGLEETDARRRASEIVALPGCSEHQLGLAVDVASYVMKNFDDPLTEAFADQPEGLWLSRNAAEYGFILRYPKHKTEITQIVYEPWHYRYVGADHAKTMKAHDMCLEEYIPYISH